MRNIKGRAGSGIRYCGDTFLVPHPAKNMYRFDEINHIHLLDEQPLIGTSTAVKVIAKPLTYWASGLAVEQFGWLNPKKHTQEECTVACEDGLARVQKLTRDEYAKLLDKAYRAHAQTLKKSAVKGTDLHAELERYVRGKMTNEPIEPIEQIKPFVAWAEQNIKKWLWSELHCYSKRLWTGGISDAGAEMQDGIIALFDFKSSSDAYADQFYQCAGYDIAISETGGYTEDGQKIFTLEKPIETYFIVPFGAKDITPRPTRFIIKSREAFEAAVALHKINQLFNYE